MEMPKNAEDGFDLRDEVSQAITGSADPEALDSYRFALGILPAFRLIRALFSQSELDTCLKLMVLFELSRTPGRFSIERIRSLAAFLEADRVDALMRSLKDGGWLVLRSADNTYTLSSTGMSFLAMLHAADLRSLSPANLLARAAQSAELSAKLEGTGGVSEYLLDHLLVLLEDQVDQARQILRVGNAHRMIAWARRHHSRQIEIIHEVLKNIGDKLDDSSRQFGKIVRLHDSMQLVIEQLRSIHERLTEWNVDRLHTAHAGYSIPALCEAVMGVEDHATFWQTLESGIVQVPQVPPTLTTNETRMRFEAARRRIPSQREVFSYQAPDAPQIADWKAADIDPAAALRTAITEALADRTCDDPAVEMDTWMTAESFAKTAYQLCMLSRIEEDGGLIRLDDGRVARMELLRADITPVSFAELLSRWEVGGRLFKLGRGLFSRVKLTIAADESRSDCRYSLEVER